MKKVDGKDNVADLFTKYLKRDDIDRLLHSMGMHLVSGRADLGLKISSMISGTISNSDKLFDEDATTDTWLNLKGNRSPCGTRYSNNECQFQSRVYDLSGTAIQSLREELCSNVRWVRIHQLSRNALFSPVGWKDGPSQRSHVPNFRISVLDHSATDRSVVIVDQWKSHDLSIKDEYKGWTAFAIFLPKSFDDCKHYAVKHAQ